VLRTECTFQLVTDSNLIKCWDVERTSVLFFNVYIYIIMWGAIILSNPSDYSIVRNNSWLEENLYCFSGRQKISLKEICTIFFEENLH